VAFLAGHVTSRLQSTGVAIAATFIAYVRRMTSLAAVVQDIHGRNDGCIMHAGVAGHQQERGIDWIRGPDPLY
jgi:hypothetical protein